MPANRKLKVTFFQRRPRHQFSFSLEYIFTDVRERLKNKIDPKVKISRFYNDGILTKIYNLFEATLRQGKNINHITGEMHFLDLLMRKATVVLTVLDCGMMQRREGIGKYFVKLLYLDLPVRRARFITAISEETKKDIVKYTNCPAAKVSVIPVAVDSIFTPYPQKFNSAKPTILHIGTGYNKNLLRLISALDGIECKLRIIGNLKPEQIELLQNSSISYESASGLSQEEMLEEYKKCDIVAFVSTFEGFGMPIVEANSVERAVITSDLSSMPEVAGDAAHLVDPYDVNAIRTGILRLINDAEYREKLIENGRRNKLRFDPDTIAGAYLNIYEYVSGDN